MMKNVVDMWSGRTRWRRRRRALWLAAGCAALLCAAAALAGPARAAAAAEFPHLPPHALAHALADFTNHPKIFPHLGLWTLEEEGGNYTHWWYSVSYECGARCSGRAAVRAQQLGGPLHGAARAHRVLLAHRTCSHLPLISWLTLCEDWEIESWITQLEEGAGGSRLRERWTARGGGGLPMPGARAAALADRAAQRILRLRAIFELKS